MKIFCIGRNYVDHIEELKNEKGDVPLVFMKPPTALLRGNQPFFLPDFSEEVHFECEWVVKIGKNGKAIHPKFAEGYFSEMTVGIDFTARDLQTRLKEKGHPWEIAKGFDQSACIGSWKNFEPPNPSHTFKLEKNGEIVQKGDSRKMIYSLPEILAYISRYFTVQKGDLIFTGTPAGVGPCHRGDLFRGFLNEEPLLECLIK